MPNIFQVMNWIKYQRTQHWNIKKTFFEHNVKENAINIEFNTTEILKSKYFWSKCFRSMGVNNLVQQQAFAFQLTTRESMHSACIFFTRLLKT